MTAKKPRKAGKLVQQLISLILILHGMAVPVKPYLPQKQVAPLVQVNVDVKINVDQPTTIYQ